VRQPSRLAFEPADPGDPSLSVDGLDDLLPERGQDGDPALSVSALAEFFAPEAGTQPVETASESQLIPAPVAAPKPTRASEPAAPVAPLEDRPTTPAPRLVVSSTPPAIAPRRQESFAPEFTAPSARDNDDPRPYVVKRAQDTFAPELETPKRSMRAVEEPPVIKLAETAPREPAFWVAPTETRSAEVDPEESDESEDRALAIDSRGEFLAPDSAAHGAEKIDQSRPDHSEFHVVAVEFRRFAEEFHAFAVDCKPR
jgi:hypothetical protein